MPESRSRKKKHAKNSAPKSPAEQTTAKPSRFGSGRWVVPAMCTFLLVGLAWIVTFYLSQGDLPGMRQLGDWNLLVGMGLIMLGLLTAMKWE